MIVFLALFIALGFWQIDRAHQKERLLSAQERAARAAPVDLGQWLAAGKPLSALYLHHVRIKGKALTGHVLLQDEQTRDTRVGYHLWVPVELRAAPRVILINRGWIPQASDRKPPEKLPELHANGVFTGLLEKLPRAGLDTGGSSCRKTGWPHLVLYPHLVNMQCLFEKPLLAGIVRLDADSPGSLGGLKTGLPKHGMTPMRHYGYAFQWFALGLTVVVVYLVLNFKRRRHSE